LTYTILKFKITSIQNINQMKIEGIPENIYDKCLSVFGQKELDNYRTFISFLTDCGEIVNEKIIDADDDTGMIEYRYVVRVDDMYIQCEFSNGDDDDNT
jgi:hypothetical protein